MDNVPRKKILRQVSSPLNSNTSIEDKFGALEKPENEEDEDEKQVTRKWKIINIGGSNQATFSDSLLSEDFRNHLWSITLFDKLFRKCTSKIHEVKERFRRYMFDLMIEREYEFRENCKRILHEEDADRIEKTQINKTSSRMAVVEDIKVTPETDGTVALETKTKGREQTLASAANTADCSMNVKGYQGSRGKTPGNLRNGVIKENRPMSKVVRMSTKRSGLEDIKVPQQVDKKPQLELEVSYGQQATAAKTQTEKRSSRMTAKQDTKVPQETDRIAALETKTRDQEQTLTSTPNTADCEMNVKGRLGSRGIAPGKLPLAECVSNLTDGVIKEASHTSKVVRMNTAMSGLEDIRVPQQIDEIPHLELELSYGQQVPAAKSVVVRMDPATKSLENTRVLQQTEEIYQLEKEPNTADCRMNEKGCHGSRGRTPGKRPVAKRVPNITDTVIKETGHTSKVVKMNTEMSGFEDIKVPQQIDEIPQLELELSYGQQAAAAKTQTEKRSSRMTVVENTKVPQETERISALETKTRHQEQTLTSTPNTAECRMNVKGCNGSSCIAPGKLPVAECVSNLTDGLIKETAHTSKVVRMNTEISGLEDIRVPQQIDEIPQLELEFSYGQQAPAAKSVVIRMDPASKNLENTRVLQQTEEIYQLEPESKVVRMNTEIGSLEGIKVPQQIDEIPQLELETQTEKKSSRTVVQDTKVPPETDRTAALETKTRDQEQAFASAPNTADCRMNEKGCHGSRGKTPGKRPVAKRVPNITDKSKGVRINTEVSGFEDIKVPQQIDEIPQLELELSYGQQAAAAKPNTEDCRMNEKRCHGSRSKTPGICSVAKCMSNLTNGVEKESGPTTVVRVLEKIIGNGELVDVVEYLLRSICLVMILVRRLLCSICSLRISGTLGLMCLLCIPWTFAAEFPNNESQLLSFTTLTSNRCDRETYRFKMHCPTHSYFDLLISHCEFQCGKALEPQCIPLQNGSVYICHEIGKNVPPGQMWEAYTRNNDSSEVFIIQKKCPKNTFQPWPSDGIGACKYKHANLSELPEEFDVSSEGDNKSPTMVHCAFNKGFFSYKNEAEFNYDHDVFRKPPNYFCTRDNSHCSEGQMVLHNGSCVSACATGFFRDYHKNFTCQRIPRNDLLSTSVSVPSPSFPAVTRKPTLTSPGTVPTTNRSRVDHTNLSDPDRQSVRITVATVTPIMIVLLVIVLCVLCRYWKTKKTRRNNDADAIEDDADVDREDIADSQTLAPGIGNSLQFIDETHKEEPGNRKKKHVNRGNEAKVRRMNGTFQQNTHCTVNNHYHVKSHNDLENPLKQPEDIEMTELKTTYDEETSLTEQTQRKHCGFTDNRENVQRASPTLLHLDEEDPVNAETAGNSSRPLQLDRDHERDACETNCENSGNNNWEFQGRITQEEGHRPNGGFSGLRERHQITVNNSEDNTQIINSYGRNEYGFAGGDQREVSTVSEGNTTFCEYDPRTTGNVVERNTNSLTDQSVRCLPDQETLAICGASSDEVDERSSLLAENVCAHPRNIILGNTDLIPTQHDRMCALVLQQPDQESRRFHGQTTSILRFLGASTPVTW